MKCARCGRELKHPKYVGELGIVLGPYGSTCAKKQLQMPLALHPKHFELKDSDGHVWASGVAPELKPGQKILPFDPNRKP